MRRRLPATLLPLALVLAAAAPGAAAQERGSFPTDLDGWMERQDRMIDGGEGSRALAEAKERVSKEPKSAEARFLAGRILLAAGTIDEAKANFEEAIALDANYPAAWRGMAECHLSRKEYDTAAREARKARELDPSTAATVLLVNVLMQKGDRNEAQTLLEEGVRKNPDDNRLRFLYAHLLRVVGLLQDAERELRQVLAKEPAFVPAWQELASLLVSTGRREGAGAELKEAVRKNPVNLGLRRVYVTHLVDGREFGAAADQMESVLLLDLPPQQRRAVEEDLRRLRSEDEKASKAAAGEKDSPVVGEKEILEKLGSKSAEDRLDALRTLARAPLLFVPFEVSRCTVDDDERVRLAALRILARYPADRHVGLLDLVLFHLGKGRDPSMAVRTAAIRTLGKNPSPAALPVLVRALDDPEPEILGAVLLAFRDGPAAKSFVDDPEAPVPEAERTAVRARIAKWWFEDPTANLWRRKAAEAIGRGGSPNLGLAVHVVPWVEEEDPGIRAAVLSCLAALTGDEGWRTTPTGTPEERKAVRERAFAEIARLQNQEQR